jgi:ribosome-binding factor A
MPSERRHARIQKFIERVLGEALHEEIARQDVLISVTEVRTTADLQWADISVSVFPYNKSGEIMELLEKRAGFFQSILNRRLKIRHTPKIRFLLDSRLEAGIADL